MLRVKRVTIGLIQSEIYYISTTSRWIKYIYVYVYICILEMVKSSPTIPDRSIRSPTPRIKIACRGPQRRDNYRTESAAASQLLWKERRNTRAASWQATHHLYHLNIGDEQRCSLVAQLFRARGFIPRALNHARWHSTGIFLSNWIRVELRNLYFYIPCFFLIICA